MSKKIVYNLEERIGRALDGCIGKMADRLDKTFDPEDKASLALFKEFRSALNARRQWQKSLAQKGGPTEEQIQNAKETLEKKSMREYSTPAWPDPMLNKGNAKVPTGAEQRANGLLAKAPPSL